MYYVQFYIFCFIYKQNVPTHLINMYTTKHLTAEEHAQLRLFSMKLQCVPTQIMAGRLFVVDIELLAPVSTTHIFFT